MTKNLIVKKVFVFLILGFLAISVSACFPNKSSGNLGNSNLSNNTNQPEVPDLEEFEEQYKTSLQEILNPYWQNNEIAGIKGRIIDLKAPAKYLDLHFNLVIAFEMIEQGSQDADQAQIEEGLEKISGLRSEFNWLDEN